MNTEVAWDRNIWSQADNVSSLPHLIGKDMVTGSFSKTKNGKAAVPSDLGSEIVKAAGGVRADMIVDLINQIIGEGVIPPGWKFNTIVNCYNRKGYALERGNLRGQKLIYQILKVVERVIDMLIGQ